MTLPISCACCGPGKAIHREEGKLWVSVCVCVCVCVYAWRRKTWKQRGSHWFYAHKFFSAEFCGVTYKLLSKPCFFFFLASRSAASTVQMLYLQLRYICLQHDGQISQMELPVLPPPHCSPISIMNFLFTICVKCTKGMWLCVCLSVCVCVWERPCVLTLPIVFTATRLAICSEAQTVLCVLFEGCCSRFWLHFLPPPAVPFLSGVKSAQ